VIIEKILLIISLKEESLKQNKPKNGAGDSTVVIIDSDNDDDNDSTILLPVPTAS